MSDLDVFSTISQKKFASTMLHENLKLKAYKLLQMSHRKKFLKNKNEALQWQDNIRKNFFSCIGPFPYRSPLNPKIMGKVKMKNYDIEKIIFQSRPNFFVTANLYIPQGIKMPFPSILVLCGHSQNGKAYIAYQRLCAGLAQKGYLVFIYDPLGQGERRQYLNHRAMGIKEPNCVYEHCYAGNQLLLIGNTLASFKIWDGIRAIDYLESRPEVDKRRIGCTGCSGGGTLTSYISAVDKRIKVSIPVCYITTRKLMIDEAHIADAEQVPPDIIKHGIDHSDILSLIAPRPLRIIGARKDFFPIEGTYEAYESLHPIYSAFNAEDNISFTEAYTEHGYFREERELAYLWFNRWLDNISQSALDLESNTLPDKMLWCTKSGQVSELKSNTVFSYSRICGSKARSRLSDCKSKKDIRKLRDGLKKETISLLRLSKLMAKNKPVLSMHGKIIKRRLYKIKKMSFTSEKGIIIPALLFEPKQSRKVKDILIYIHDHGKHADAASNGWLEQLCGIGIAILSIDYRGIGETLSGVAKYGRRYSFCGSETYHTYNSFMVGEPLLGLRLLDVLKGVESIENASDFKSYQFHCYGIGQGGILAVFLALINNKIKSVCLENMLVSYKSIIEEEYYQWHVSSFVPSVIKHFDIPDVLAALAPRPLIICNPLNGQKTRLKKYELNSKYTSVKKAYSFFKCEDFFVENMTVSKKRKAIINFYQEKIL